MNDETALELLARRLEGESLSRVVYLDPWPGIDRADPSDVDTVGLAVFLEISSGRILEVRWADELGLRHGFGVALREVALIDGDRGRLDDATDRWTALLGERITTATVRWGFIHDDLRQTFRIGLAICADHLTRADYPSALELVFADGSRVVIATGFSNGLVVARAFARFIPRR